MAIAASQHGDSTKVLGTRALRVEGRGLVSGRAKYIGDLVLPDMLHMKAKLSPYANARLISIDTRRAKALPGVVEVLTHRDVPVNRHGLAVADQPVLVDEWARHLGEPVAVVAAVDELTAAEAVALIDVEWEPHQPVTDALEAMKPDAPVIHEGGNIAQVDAKHPARRLRMGDVEAAFAAADHLVESTYSTSVREHAAMEVHASVAEVDATGKITVHTCSQAPHLHQGFVAQILGLPLHKVRLAGGRVGGAFGKANDLELDHLTALMAHRVGRPVKWVLTREEEMLITSKDQAYPKIHLRSAVMADGTITARKIEAVQDTGAYNLFGTGGIDKISVYLRGPYDIPNYSFDGWCVYTNKPPSAAMRGFNVADAHIACEGHMDEIAAAIGMDPLELRWRNLIHDGDRTSTQGVMQDATIEECLAACADRFGWQLPTQDRPAARPVVKQPDSPYKKRGVGICAGIQGTGLTCGSDPGMAEIELLPDGTFICRVGVAEIGAGEGTTLSMIAAEQLGVPLDAITMTLGDTDHTPFDTGTFGNRVTYVNGQAVMRAAQATLEICREVAARQLDVPVDDLRAEHGAIASISDPSRRMTMAEIGTVARWVLGSAVVGRGSHMPDAGPFDPDNGSGKPTEAYIFAACMMEVEVDTRTGKVDVVRSVLVHDVGKAINPLFAEGQMDGGMPFGTAMALLEDVYPGYPAIAPVARGLHEYKLLTAMDVHDDHQNVLLEIPSTTGPYGAKALGEYPANLQAPAIFNAIYDATGVRVRHAPTPPDKLLRLLHDHAGEEAGA